MKTYRFGDALLGYTYLYAPNPDAARIAAYSYIATHPDNWRAPLIEGSQPEQCTPDPDADFEMPQPDRASWPDEFYRTRPLYIAYALHKTARWGNRDEMYVTADHPALALELFKLRYAKGTISPEKLDYGRPVLCYEHHTLGSLMRDRAAPVRIQFVDQVGNFRTVRRGAR